MYEIPGYQIEDKIYESVRTEIYRGLRQADNQPVILKTLRNKYPTPAEAAWLKREYDLINGLDYPGAIRVLGIETYANSPVIIMEDFGGEPLSHFLKNQQLQLNELLAIAIKMTNSLEKIHEQGIIHKDINPENIIWNPETNQLKTIDFGISTRFSRENLAIRNPQRLEGTLAYISPEQTGRMNRQLDYRTDFYSLGVTFYQMFTGRMPFETTDTLELVHCHIAKMPVPLYEIDPRIPITLSRIIMKLLAKAAEDRYQSIHGLKTDLEECMNRLNKGDTDDFAIGQNDVTEKFRIPEKIYGRDKEIASLLNVFHRVTFGQKDIIFFSGPPGIGKSVLIHEIHKPVIEKRAYFCRGKNDQYKKNIPYTAIIQAFRELLRQTLSESEEKLATLKKEIFEAVGGSGQVLIDVISEVELITGKQPDVQELPPAEAQNRFNIVFQNFVKVFATKQHPLVLFLDDLQWADNAGLELIRVLVEDPELNYFLFIGAYRDNEVDQGHPFMVMLEKLGKAGYSWRDIKVGPLNEDQVGQLVADTLYCDTEKANDLSKLLIQKTGGNPFFLKEYLKTLYEQGLIEYTQSFKEGAGWTWDVTRIKQAGITDNVVELMAGKVKKLPENTWNVLKVACCMGSNVFLVPLASACGKPKEDTLNDLKEAIDEGILIIIEDNLKFVHDRVWEAAYSLITEKERKELHYSIGKEMIGEGDKDQVEDSIFNIANQWNHAKELLNDNEKKQLLGIDFQAGEKAKTSAAYAPAVDFFRQGTELFPDDSWEKDYQFTLSYYTEWSEAEYLARNINDAERLFDIVLKNAKELMDKMEIYSLQIHYYVTQMQYEKALEVGLKALKQLGIPVPEKPGKPAIMRELLKAKMLSRKRKIQDWLHQPEMTDAKKITAMNIMQKCQAPALAVAPNLLPLFVLKGVNLTFKYGNTYHSASAYSAYAVIISALLLDIDNGYEFGKLAEKLADKFNVNIVKAGVYFALGYLVLHLKRPFKDVSEYFMKAREVCLAAGDFVYLGYSYCNYGSILLFSGERLDSINTNFFQKYHDNITKLNQPQLTSYFNLWKQAILNLAGEAEDILLLKGNAFNEEKTIPTFQQTKDETGLSYYYIIKQFTSFLMGEYSDAYNFSQRAEEFKDNIIGSPGIQISHFLYALVLSSLFPDAAGKDKKKYLKKLRAIQKKFKKWGEHNKYNYLNKYLLISAEINRITGKGMQETAKLYSDAIRSAHENEIIYEEAIANDLAALYYLSLGQEKVAALYMNEAHYCYMRWGCKPKVKALEEKYPDWISGGKRQEKVSVEGISVTAGTTGTSEALDLGTIIKASNTIAREIKLGELLEKMMHIVIENAGAQKGYFLLSKNREWFIEAQGDMDQKDVEILQSIPIDTLNGGSGEHPSPTPSTSPEIAKSIVKYVERTKDTVVLSDAAHEGNFTEDEYIQTQKPKSILCLPLLNQGELAGILYMENNLATGAFTPDRLIVLNTISSQIAISIENARMYEELDELNKNLEQKVADRTLELREKNEQILSSIRYSERIQAAAMPQEEKIKAALQDHFILFLPRDIVSGDFYWFNETDDFMFFAVVDCTGHGVPGALLAMMGDIFLKEIIITRKVIEPGKILEELNKKVRTHLRQEEDKAETMDGMDVCLCRLEREKNKIQFAGAKRPLYIVRKTGIEKGKDMRDLIEIKGDKKSIGGRQKEINRTYTSHEIEVREGDMIYLTSDGFVDQPDPILVLRYGSRRLKAFLESLAGFPAERQKQFLLEELHSYQDTEKQRDDITVVGIRI